MTIARLSAIFLALLVLQGCDNPEQYPISGEACAPDDPVQELSIENCLPPV
ncbi:hypothetical protein [Tateyamaria sp. SN3-11]|uniref:hypothetical protein n=1 Tax=Tateyamaria sp. SN3-11 TaxID=3092147 RepID=UPI0039EB6D13